MERGLNFTAAGAVSGGLVGLMTSGYFKPVAGEASLAYVAKASGGHAALFAGMAGIFAVSETFLDQTRGHSPVNSAIAGCAAGALIGAKAGDPTRMAFGCGLFGAVQAFGARALPHRPPLTHGALLSTQPPMRSLTRLLSRTAFSQVRWPNGGRAATKPCGATYIRSPGRGGARARAPGATRTHHGSVLAAPWSP